VERLESVGALLVKQKKEWGEILSGFETKNKYSISDVEGKPLLFAAEESSFLVRMFLKAARPLTLHVLTPEGKPLLQFYRPFRWFLSEMHIKDVTGAQIGWIKQKFSILSKQFLIYDTSGNEIFKIHGPLLHPWTFHIMENEREAGKIQKKWSGIGKEMFTDADNFNIIFPPDIGTSYKAILLGALFLVDLLYFEKKD